MGDNTKSTSKEEEMLEQTFGNYDSELTGETSAGSFDPKNAGEKKKGGKSSNKIIFIGVAVVALIMIIYNFVLPMFMPAAPKRPVNNNAVNNNAANPANNNVNANNANPNAANVASGNGVTPGNPTNNGLGPQGPSSVNPVVNPVVNPTPPVDPNAAAMQAFLNQQQAPAANANNTPSTNVSLNLPPVNAAATPAATPPVDTKTVTVSATPTSTTTTVTASTPTAAASTPVEVKPAAVAVVTTPATTPVVETKPAVVDSAASSNLLDGMKSYFDKQFSDVKSDISKFNKDIEKQAEATTALTSVVKDIDARLKKLEGGGGVAKVASSRPARAVSNSKVVRAKAHPAQPAMVAAKNDKPVQIINGNPAKSIISDEQILIVSKAAAQKPLPMVRENPNGLITKYKIHSLYAGRVWIANSDNTHSNFSVGDRLPEGETIRGVDMDKGVITTDRGIIKVY